MVWKEEGNKKGDLYEGEWQNGQMNGQGIYKYANDDVYEGFYLNGKYHGYGSFKSGDGLNSYIG